MRYRVILLLIVSFTTKIYADDTFKGPWQDHTIKVIPKTTNVSANPLLNFVKFFRDTISPIDGSRCSMYPTCSQYSVESFKKHGVFLGWLLTCDRLLHEADEVDFSKIKNVRQDVMKGGIDSVPTRVIRKPIFVEVMDYNKVLGEIDRIKKDSVKSKKLGIELNEIKIKKEKRLENWDMELEKMQKNLMLIDTILFEGE